MEPSAQKLALLDLKAGSAPQSRKGVKSKQRKANTVAFQQFLSACFSLRGDSESENSEQEAGWTLDTFRGPAELVLHRVALL